MRWWAASAAVVHFAHGACGSKTSFWSPFFFHFIFGWPALVSLGRMQNLFYSPTSCSEVYIFVSKEKKIRWRIKNTQTRQFARGCELIGLPSNKSLPTDTNKTKIKVNAPRRTKEKAELSIFRFIFVCVEPKWFVLIYCGDEQLPVWRISHSSHTSHEHEVLKFPVIWCLLPIFKQSARYTSQAQPQSF